MGRRPLEVVRPEFDFKPVELLQPDNHDPLSFLLTLQQIDDQRLDAGNQDDPKAEKAAIASFKELDGLDLLNGNWELGGVDQQGKFVPGKCDQDEVVFRRSLSKWGLEVRKRYHLEKVPEDQRKNDIYPAYSLRLGIEIRNLDHTAHKVAYQLDGPTGLPAEGWWYAIKVCRSGSGLRDVVVSSGGPNSVPKVFGPVEICKTGVSKRGILESDPQLTFMGVDAQYFSAVMIPQGDETKEETAFRIAEYQPICVGEYDPQTPTRTNTSIRVGSAEHELKPGQTWTSDYRVFAGPKMPDLMAEYGLKEIVYYGWFKWVAIPLLWILHFFHDYVVFNYGLAIIMLTVLVRACMFPLSKQQAMNAQKMAELQPEIKKIQEKYKTNMEARGKAQQELFKKHNYRPLGGCLVVFFQLPIFVGLYNSLRVNVQLRQAPLFTENIRLGI